jgi:diguanylate cyclase (GGDEF)-like protein
MTILSWFDNRTLIACEFMLAVLFTVVFFGLRRIYPNLRGVSSIAFSFLFGVPGSVLLASRGTVSYFASVMVANAFVLGSFILLYRGILRFIGSRSDSSLPWTLSSFSLAILFYYSEVHDSIVPRIVAVSLTVGVIRGLIALELFRKARTSSGPVTMRLFASSMAFFAVASFSRGFLTLLRGAPTNFLQNDAVQTSSLILGVLSVCLTGLFFLILASLELINRSRDESHLDELSGAFNRRGIEVRLAKELQNHAAGNGKLTIALVDIDHFKSINDSQGHAAGDAALRDVVHAISSRLRGHDHLGRFGGDEFLLVLPQTPCGEGLTIAERLGQAVTNLHHSGPNGPLTVSVGLTQAVDGDSAVTLIARADKALYQAKTDGRNCRRVCIEGGAFAPSSSSAADRVPMTSIEPQMVRH